ncbi:MAG: ATP-binding protein [Rhodobacteraceae bacterium]|nr:ATP-binding protein [Paracoccaceae bacterium]
MLVEFSVENFRSIKQEARLSLVSGPAKERRETYLLAPALSKQSGSIKHLLPSAAIYGANAAGKSNLIRALSVMQDIILDTSRNVGPIPVKPFLFDSASRDKPTTFEVMFLTEGVRYQYGFSATAKAVTEEWLYAWPSGRLQTWFQRSAGHWKFGEKLTGDKEIWRRSTRPDALFLSTAVSLNSKLLQPVSEWFRDKLRVVVSDSWNRDWTLNSVRGEDKTEVIEFLQAADLGISDLTLVEKEFHPGNLPAGMPSELKDLVAKNLSGTPKTELRLVHETGQGVPVSLDFDDESDGTRKIFDLAGPWLDTLQNGRVVVIDELNNSLHPALVRFLVERFHDPDVNSRGAQLIFSTHDTSILSRDVFRRDQIWFCERNEFRETTLFSLSDFRARKKSEILDRSYLSGRYGALPYIAPSLATAGR